MHHGVYNSMGCTTFTIIRLASFKLQGCSDLCEQKNIIIRQKIAITIDIREYWDWKLACDVQSPTALHLALGGKRFDSQGSFHLNYGGEWQTL